MKADILTAKNAGVTSVGCLWGFGRKEDLAALGADVLISKPGELVEFVDNNRVVDSYNKNN